MNFFLDDISNVPLAALRAFLGLDLPDEQRPREGQRLDFKKGIPDTLGEEVAGMANTTGGLILIGVESDKAKQNIAIKAEGIRMADAVARVTDRNPRYCKSQAQGGGWAFSG